MTSRCKSLGDDSNTARFLEYWAKLYDSLNKGDDYKNLTKTVVILFIDYEDNLIDNIPKINTSWHIREDTYTDIILTDFFEFRIISLRKLENLANNRDLRDLGKKILISWLKFLRNPNCLEVSDMENEEIKDAKKEFEKIQADEQERELARLREKYVLEMNDAENRGIRKESKRVATKLKQLNIPLETIIEATGLTKEEIEKL